MDFHTKIITNLTETFGKENEKNEKDKNNKLAQYLINCKL